MRQQLDNPVWNAMLTGNKHLSLGSEKAKYFLPAVSPFAGLAEITRENLEELLHVVPHDTPVALFTNDKSVNPYPWTLVNRIDGFQMLYEGAPLQISPEVTFIKLSDEHVPAMLELTKISPPGPFAERTIAFGGYEGIFADRRLVAMAGHRFRSGEYVEISAVCTHPNYTGRGYARHLLLKQVKDLQADGKIPYLHVRADNTRAINIYNDLGFRTRAEMFIYVLKKG